MVLRKNDTDPKIGHELKNSQFCPNQADLQAILPNHFVQDLQ